MDDIFDRPLTDGHLGYHADKGAVSVTLLVPQAKLSTKEMKTIFASTMTLYSATEAPAQPVQTEDPLLDW